MSISWVDASRLARHTKVIAVADVVESVRLMELDEQEFIRRWHGFVGFAMQHLPLETGRMHKSLGDGLMMEFSDPEGCIRAALAMQEWFEEGNQELPPDRHVHLRIGAHVAEFVSDEHDIYGTDVNLTARIVTLAGPGEIVITAALRDRLPHAMGAEMADLGTCHLKHVRHPVHAFRVARPGRAPLLPGEGAASWQARPALAVLPFQVDGSLHGAAEAVADEVVAALCSCGELEVVSRLATARLSPERGTLDGLSRHLRANYVLRGRVRQHEDRIALFVELTDSSTAVVAWAQSFKATTGELMEPDCELMRRLVAGLTSGIMARELERAQGQALPALENHSLLLAAIALMQRFGEADLQRAHAMLEHLVERNRHHAGAQAWLAHATVLRVLQAWSADPAREAQLAQSACAAALRADSGSTVAMCIQGHAVLHLQHDVQAAAARYRQVLSARPDDWMALLFEAERLALQGQSAAAAQAADRAARFCTLEPLLYLADHARALAAVSAGEAAGAVRHAQRCVDARPGFAAARCTLVAALGLAGEHEAADAELARWNAERPDLAAQACLARMPAGPALAERLSQGLRAAGSG